jgi:hypothetical protein
MPAGMQVTITQDRPRSHLRPDVEMPNGEDALPAAVAALESQLK